MRLPPPVLTFHQGCGVESGVSLKKADSVRCKIAAVV